MNEIVINNDTKKILNAICLQTGIEYKELELVYRLGFFAGRIEALEQGLRY